LYAQAKNGKIDTLIGVNSDYLPPENPDLVIDTEDLSPAEAVDAIINHLYQTGWEESKRG
jgi:sulfate adenylyltransferase